MHRDLDELFNNAFTAQGAGSSAGNMPSVPMDIYTEGNDRLVIESQLAGFSPEDVEIRVRDNIIEVSGERKQEEEHEDRERRNYMVRQSVQRFTRSLALPEDADTSDIEAEFEDGVLRIRIPLTTARNDGRSITINRGHGRAGRPGEVSAAGAGGTAGTGTAKRGATGDITEDMMDVDSMDDETSTAAPTSRRSKSTAGRSSGTGRGRRSKAI
jgi:HSP20 family protein